MAQTKIQSPFERLRSALESNGVHADINNLKSLLRVLNVPSSLLGLIGPTGLFKKVSHLLPQVHAQLPYMEYVPIKEWYAISEFIAESPPAAFFGTLPIRTYSTSAVDGAHKDFPVYHAFEASPPPRLKRNIDVLKTLLLGLQMRRRKREDLEPSAKDLSRVIYHGLEDSAKYSNFLEMLPAQLIDLLSYREQIHSLTPPNSQSETYKVHILAAIKILLEPIENNSGSRNHREKPRSDTSFLQFKQNSTIADIDPYPDYSPPAGRLLEAADLNENIEQVAPPLNDGNRDNNWIDQSTRPSNYAHFEDEWTSERNSSPDAQTVIHRARGRLNAQGRHNQYLFNDYRYLNNREISTLLESDLILNQQVDDQNFTNKIICLVILTVGRVPESIKFVDELNHKVPKKGEILICLPEKQWVALLALPADRYHPTSDEVQYLEQVEDQLALPLPEICSQFIEFTSSDVIHVNKLEISLIDKQLKELNHQFGTRLSVSRISRFLTSRLLRLTDDLVEVSLLTGDNEGCRHSGLYYYSPAVSRLENLYEKALINLPKKHQNAGIRLNIIGQIGFDFDKSNRVGSALMPTNIAIDGLIHHLKKLLDDRPTRLRKTEDILNFHNHLSAYTYMLLQFSTGTRGIHLPIRRPIDLDLARGVAILSDKDQHDNSSTRYVPLPALVVEHLQMYLEHLEALHIRTEIPHPISDMMRGPLLYFLAEDGSFKTLGPSTIKPYTSPVWPKKSDVPRHWFRTSMREHGVPAEVVDAITGHARYMQGAHDIYSTLTVSEISNCIAPVIEKCLVTLGWIPVRGLRVKKS